MFSFFKKQEKIEENAFPIKKEKIPKIERTAQPIDQVYPAKNNNKNFIIMDDSYGSAMIINYDFEWLKTVAAKLNEDKDLSSSEQEFVSSINSNILSMLMEINFDNINVFVITGDMAAFSVINAMERNGLVPDIAILDIVVGGAIVENNKTIILDGIDVAKAIWDKNKDANILFFTGCDIGKTSEENLKFLEMNKGDIYPYLILKDPNIIFRRTRLLEILFV